MCRLFVRFLFLLTNCSFNVCCCLNSRAIEAQSIDVLVIGVATIGIVEHWVFFPVIVFRMHFTSVSLLRVMESTMLILFFSSFPDSFIWNWPLLNELFYFDVTHRTYAFVFIAYGEFDTHLFDRLAFVNRLIKACMAQTDIVYNRNTIFLYIRCIQKIIMNTENTYQIKYTCRTYFRSFQVFIMKQYEKK